MENGTVTPKLNEADEHPFSLGESFWFTNTLYPVKYFVAERLAVDMIIGTDLIILHVEEMICTEQEVRF